MSAYSDFILLICTFPDWGGLRDLRGREVYTYTRAVTFEIFRLSMCMRSIHKFSIQGSFHLSDVVLAQQHALLVCLGFQHRLRSQQIQIHFF